MTRITGQPAPLFPRLPRGPSGMGPEEVARDQRARMFAAMIESVARHGYGGTTVAQVIALAGVSRRAFYEQFSNKEDCFLATHDIVVARARKRAIDAWQRERGWANRLHASCQALLEHVAAAPDGPRLALVHSPGVGSGARARAQLTGLTFERLLAQGLALAPDGVQVTPLQARAIVGGARHLLCVRLLDGRERELGLLAGELLDWIEAYRSPAAAHRSGPAAPGELELPTGAAAFLTVQGRRAQALTAFAELAAERGYGALGDREIAARAGISPASFRSQFAGKQACLMALLHELQHETLGAVERSMAEVRPWPTAVQLGLHALVGQLIARRALARIAFIDGFEAGPAVVRRMCDAIQALSGLLTPGAPPPRRGRAISAEAVAGGLWSIVSSHVARDRLPLLGGRVQELAYIVLAPYLGSRGAAEELETVRRSAPWRPARPA